MPDNRYGDRSQKSAALKTTWTERRWRWRLQQGQGSRQLYAAAQRLRRSCSSGTSSSSPRRRTPAPRRAQTFASASSRRRPPSSVAKRGTRGFRRPRKRRARESSDEHTGTCKLKSFIQKHSLDLGTARLLRALPVEEQRKILSAEYDGAAAGPVRKAAMLALAARNRCASLWRGVRSMSRAGARAPTRGHPVRRPPRWRGPESRADRVALPRTDHQIARGARTELAREKEDTVATPERRVPPTPPPPPRPRDARDGGGAFARELVPESWPKRRIAGRELTRSPRSQPGPPPERSAAPSKGRWGGVKKSRLQQSPLAQSPAARRLGPVSWMPPRPHDGFLWDDTFRWQASALAPRRIPPPPPPPRRGDVALPENSGNCQRTGSRRASQSPSFARSASRESRESSEWAVSSGQERAVRRGPSLASSASSDRPRSGSRARAPPEPAEAEDRRGESTPEQSEAGRDRRPGVEESFGTPAASLRCDEPGQTLCDDVPAPQDREAPNETGSDTAEINLAVRRTPCQAPEESRHATVCRSSPSRRSGDEAQACRLELRNVPEPCRAEGGRMMQQITRRVLQLLAGYPLDQAGVSEPQLLDGGMLRMKMHPPEHGHGCVLFFDGLTLGDSVLRAQLVPASQ